LDTLPVILYGRSLGASLAVHAGAHAHELPNMRVCGVIVESGLMEWASLPVVQSLAEKVSERRSLVAFAFGDLISAARL
jgi:pimeloyl-ACP methyl ester carboxylesterase